MADELKSYPIRNLVQGVSQQTPQQRRDTQCEEQFDCVNSPVNGCEARPHADLMSIIKGASVLGGYFYEIFRGDEEHYLVVVTPTPNDATEGKRLRVYDMETGLPCTVTYTASEAYLATTAAPKDALVATTLNDYTFIASRETKPLMDTTVKSPARANSALIYFKAGGYSITFVVAVNYGGATYTFSYLSPDNSTAVNANYISTNQLAATFFRAFTGGAATTAPGQTGTGAAGPGQTTGMTAATTLTSLGFTCSINGSSLLITRPDDNPFSVDATDGIGDTYLKVVKNQAKAFSDLPAGAFVGFTTKVVGTNKQTEDDYWVQFKGSDGVAGYWEEVIGPDVPLTFQKATMPHALVNTGEGTFEWKQINWGNRVSGDGVNSALNPSFVGKTIEDMSFDNGRLLIMHEGGPVWSRTRNPYVFFPDTAQTTLDTDPVDITAAGGKRIAILRRIVQVNEATFLWAQKLQFRVTSGTNPFKQDTVEAKPATSFEFSPKVAPYPIGESLFFVTEPGPFATVRDLTIQDGKSQGAADITGHVKRYIPSGVRFLAASDTLGTLFVQTEATPHYIYAYSYLLTAKERIQSAWNTWRLPSDCKVVWVGASKNYLHILAQRTDGAAFLRVDMSVDLTDTDAGATYLSRMDLRVTETDCVLTYTEATDETELVLPYAVPEADGFLDQDGTNIAECPMFVANRTSEGEFLRGKSWQVTGIGPDSITVRGNAVGEKLYVGFRISAEREDSRLYLKSEAGVIATKRLTVKDYVYAYSKTGYTRAVVTYPNGPMSYEMTGRVFGDPNNVVGEHPLTEGFYSVPVNAENSGFAVRLINDSFLPSRWTSATYNYVAAFLARPTKGVGTTG